MYIHYISIAHDERPHMEQKVGESPGRDSASDGVELTLCTRRPVCGPRTSAVDRLGRLRGEGVIGDFSIETWPNKIVLDDEDRRLADLVDRLESWADEQDLSLRPPFETRTVSPLVGQSREVLTLPAMMLLVRDGDGLVGVYPCSDGDRTWTVTDCLDAVEAAGGLPHGER